MGKKVFNIARINGQLSRVKAEKVKDRTPNKKKALRITPVEEITIQLLMLNEGISDILRITRCEGDLVLYCDNHKVYCVDGARYRFVKKIDEELRG